MALIKRMIEREFPRDYIMSFFVRPGRVISPAAVGEIRNEKLGKNVEPASLNALEWFISTRLNEARKLEGVSGGPVSEIRVREVLALSHDAQASLPGFEGLFIEYKERLPEDKNARAKIARVAASLANSRGGYIFFGISDSRQILGIQEKGLSKIWHALSQSIATHFAPSFRWDHSIIEIGDRLIGAIYVYEADLKPIISCRECGNEVHSGQVYFRYSTMSKVIEPGDFLTMLAERDRLTVSRTPKDRPAQTIAAE